MRILTRQEEIQLFKKLHKDCEVNGKLMFAGRLLWRATKIRGDAIALISDTITLSYNQLYERVCALSKKLINDYGVKPRDKGIICFENSPEFYIAYFALWHAGAVVVPVNTFLKEKELGYIITDAQPTIIITALTHLSLFEQAAVELPYCITEKEMNDAVQFDSDINNPAIIDLDPDEVAALLYTSGTTGVPKGVMLSSRNIMTNVLQIASLIGIDHHERLLGVLPLFHSFAQNTCVWASLFYGITIILVAKIDRKAILQGLTHRPTVFLGVPALYGLLCMMKNAPLDSVRLFVCGGDALPDKIRSAFSLIYRRKIANGYGLTETAPVLAVDLADEIKPTSCVGKIVPFVECVIRDEKGETLAGQEIGVIWVKGDNVMLGYYHAPELTHEVLVDGWFNTGDLGYIDDQERIVITGRQKDLIINKGFNIYPQEIENILLSHPNVIRVGVVGKHDGDGEVPIAFVQMRAVQNNIEKELRALCLSHLASYKMPKQFICNTKDLPLTATGKVDKKLLRILLVSDAENN